jgi:hypothetical protein
MNIYEPLSCLVITWTKGEGHPVTCQCRDTEEVEVWLHPFATLTLTRSERSAPRRGRFIPGIETRCTLYRRLGGPRGPVWMGAENLAVTGARSQDRPASNKSLYWLSYPVGSQVNAVGVLNCLCVYSLSSFGWFHWFAQNFVRTICHYRPPQRTDGQTCER